jgi:predicted ribonuclease toxin of YeeF-YezG toxin-antitoxin module
LFRRSTSASATSKSTPSETTAAAPTTTLDISQCVDVTGANADLLTASDKDAARKAADTLEKYNKVVSEWIKAVCPT